MDYQMITSRDNPLIKGYVQLAASRGHRKRACRFVTEGAKLLFEALSAGYTLKTLFCEVSQIEQLQDRLDEYDIKPENIRLVNESVAQKLAQSQSPQGVFAVFGMLDNDSGHVKIKAGGKYVLLAGLQDPGNIGTIIRTAAAFGIDAVILSADCPDIYSLKVLRAAMGGVFRIPVFMADDMSACIDRLSGAQIPVYAAVLSDKAVSVCDVMMQSGCAVVIGNEGNGLPAEITEKCAPLIIPIEKTSESLNAAVAASILIWEMVR